MNWTLWKNRGLAIIEKFMQNPIVYGLIFCGVFGILCPFLVWIMPVGRVQQNDLEVLIQEVEKIQKLYTEAEISLKKILSSGVVKLPSDKRMILKTLIQEKRSLFSHVMAFVAFLIQGGFFFLLGLLIERRWLSKHRDKDNKISFFNKMQKFSKNKKIVQEEVVNLEIDTPMNEPVNEALDEPMTEPMDKPMDKFIDESEPVNEPMDKFIDESESVDEPMDKFIDESEPVNEPMDKFIDESESVDESVNEHIDESVDEHGDEPMDDDEALDDDLDEFMEEFVDKKNMEGKN